MGTGPDVAHSGGGETGVGGTLAFPCVTCACPPPFSRIPALSSYHDGHIDYPVWNADNATTGSSMGPLGTYFRPREADATIQNPGMSHRNGTAVR
jgi:hypothetical protein